jgi:5-methylcytosine-specific restriction endonuclease McrA
MSAINTPVLVLNRHWVPITVIRAERAIGMLFTSKARVVDAEDFSTHDFESWTDVGKIFRGDEYIKTARLKIPVPEVLLLSDSNSQPSYRRVTFSRKNLLKRDRRTCQYCGHKVATSDFTIDHIKPKSRGGPMSWANCVIACVTCNLMKDNRTPEEAGMKLLSVPTTPAPRRINYSIEIFTKKVSWQKFIKDEKTRDELASVVYWNCGLKD